MNRPSGTASTTRRSSCWVTGCSLAGSSGWVRVVGWSRLDASPGRRRAGLHSVSRRRASPALCRHPCAGRLTSLRAMTDLRESTPPAIVDGLPQRRVLVTELPGPRSRELHARKQAAVADGVGTTLPVYIER